MEPSVNHAPPNVTIALTVLITAQLALINTPISLLNAQFVSLAI
jgi:hypothetical protein